MAPRLTALRNAAVIALTLCLVLLLSHLGFEHISKHTVSHRTLEEPVEVSRKLVHVPKYLQPARTSSKPQLLRRDGTPPQPLTDEQWAARLTEACSLSQLMNNDAATAEEYYHTNPKSKDSPLESPFLRT